MKRRDRSQPGDSGSSPRGRDPRSDSKGSKAPQTRTPKTKNRSPYCLISYLKRCALVLLVTYISIPFVIRLFPALLAKVVYLNMLKTPFFVDLRHPAELMNHTTNFYLTPEEGITVGVW
ncbi:hypothetical protein FKM82_022568 [Ascaphus truei]